MCLALLWAKVLKDWAAMRHWAVDNGTTMRNSAAMRHWSVDNGTQFGIDEPTTQHHHKSISPRQSQSTLPSTYTNTYNPMYIAMPMQDTHQCQCLSDNAKPE